MVLPASVVLVITAIFQRTRWKYQDRAYRYILLDAGHLGENLYLTATSLGLGPCGIGAFLDDEINRLIRGPQISGPTTPQGAGQERSPAEMKAG